MSIRVCVCCAYQFKLHLLCCSHQEAVFGGGLIHQSLDCDTHLQKAFLFQDVVRKTQFVLENRVQCKERKERKEKEIV